MRHAAPYGPAKNRIRRFFAILGSGLIAGAADDDPSSIGTYSVVGARFGTSVLWTAFISWPLIATIQMMCAASAWSRARVWLGILIVASDRTIMRQQPSSLFARLTVAATALAMFGAAIGMFVF